MKNKNLVITKTVEESQKTKERSNEDNTIPVKVISRNKIEKSEQKQCSK